MTHSAQARHKALECAPVALCIVQDGRLVFANRACAALWGTDSAETLMSRPPGELFESGGPLAGGAVGSAAAAAASASVDATAGPSGWRARIVRLDGEPREVEIALAPFPCEPFDQAVGAPGPAVRGDRAPAQQPATQMVLRDITEQLREHEHLERSRQELQRLSASLVTAREQERQHIARELHDELGQQLTALKIGLSHLAPAQAAGRTDRVAGLIERLDETFDSLRRIATDLRPPMLDDLGLGAAIEWLALESARRLNIEVTLELTEAAPLDDQASIAVYRMVQETLTNVARHAHASRVWIETRCERGQFWLRVRDNGVGFPETAVGRQGSHGLMGIRERAAMLGGSIEIGNTQAGGGCITVRLPIDCPVAGTEAAGSEAPATDVSDPPPRQAWSLRSPEAVMHELQVHQIEVEMQNEELRRTQIELAAARDRYQSLYDHAPVGYFTLDRDGLVIEANLTGARLLGEKRSAVIRRRLARFVAAADGDRWHHHLRRAMQQDGAHRIELELRPRGSAPPMQAQIDSLRMTTVGTEAALRVTVTDITERKQAEVDRRIVTHTIADHEAERRRVARALHEELGQELSALKMEIESLPTVPSLPLRKQRIVEIQAVLDTAVATVRRIATDLRPLLLDDLGLSAAIDWLARDMAQRSGVRISLALEDGDPPLDERLTVAVYRMAQEALAQVARGKASGHIHINLHHPPGELVLSVCDDGPEQRALCEDAAMNLTELEQQTHLLRGRIEAEERAGIGRQITIRLPMLRSTDSPPLTPPSSATPPIQRTEVTP